MFQSFFQQKSPGLAILPSVFREFGIQVRAHFKADLPSLDFSHFPPRGSSLPLTSSYF
jgi:hypothetical protein